MAPGGHMSPDLNHGEDTSNMWGPGQRPQAKLTYRRCSEVSPWAWRSRQGSKHTVDDNGGGN